MEPTNTIGLVSALVTTYESSLLEYLEYSRRIWLSNSYVGRRHRFGAGEADVADGPSDAQTPAYVPGPSALRASLTVSPRKIRETYDRAFILIGAEFSRGDGRSRGALTAALSLLRTTLAPLSEALTFVPSRPRSPPPMLDLHGMTLATNKIFHATIATLAYQYQRQALARPVPRMLPGVKVPRVPSPHHHSATLEMLEEGPEGPPHVAMRSGEEREDDECSIMPGDSVTQIGITREIESEREEREERDRDRANSPRMHLRLDVDGPAKETRRSWRDWRNNEISRQAFHAGAELVNSETEEPPREKTQKKERYRRPVSAQSPPPSQPAPAGRAASVSTKSDSSTSSSQGTGTDRKSGYGMIDESRLKKTPSQARSWTTDPPSPPPTPPNTLLDLSEGSSERCMSPGGMRRIVEESEEEEESGQRTHPSLARETNSLAKKRENDTAAEERNGEGDEEEEDEYAPAMSPLSGSGTLPLRPKNSVFSMFCPEALALQVDRSRTVPKGGKCRQCGFVFSSGLTIVGGKSSPSEPEQRPMMSPKISAFLQSASASGARKGSTGSSSSERSGRSVEGAGINGAGGGGSGGSNGSVSGNSNGSNRLKLKEGFRLTGRFLAKSHCEGGKGFGCVLCTGSGWTDMYKTAKELRDHVDEAHDKWQMLHDADMK